MARVLVCGIREQGSEECALGFAQMVLDLPFCVSDMSSMSLVFADGPKDVIGTFVSDPDVDVLVDRKSVV